ncbi:kinase-like protein [Ascodesmis nigricans]|uniref:Kinase-like protein n=1 Tax=Ascodesmis nigricans TaxID=341454 RepID=A0A4S2N832_9PEZI|nr:kinase-like protein [Ascodesmis nigricans]
MAPCPIYGHLNIKPPSGSISELPITTSKITIGRSSSSSFHLPSPHISFRHLLIYTTVFNEHTAPLIYALDANSTNGTLLNGFFLPRGSPRLLLHNDVLNLPDGSKIHFEASPDGQTPFQLRKSLKKDECIHGPHYTLTNRVLGYGAFGIVYLAIAQPFNPVQPCRRPLSTTGANAPFSEYPTSPPQLACKVIDLARLDKSPGPMTRQIALREVELLTSLDHPNIISIKKVFVTTDKLYIFEELVTNGDLFAFIMARGEGLEEVEAMTVIWQLLEALRYLHGRGIAHRDLKPENILLTPSFPTGRLLLADFGCSRRFQTRMTTIFGTVEYAAPEIMHRTNGAGYSYKVDMWSLGMILHVLLTFFNPDPPTGPIEQKKRPRKRKRGEGHEIRKPALKTSPLDSLTQNPLNLKDVTTPIPISQNPYTAHTLTDERWAHISPLARDFLNSLLQVDERRRMSAEQAMEHPWLRRHKKELQELWQRAVSGWVRRKQDGKDEDIWVEDLTPSMMENPQVGHMSERGIGRKKMQAGKERDIGGRLAKINETCEETDEDNEDDGEDESGEDEEDEDMETEKGEEWESGRRFQEFADKHIHGNDGHEGTNQPDQFDHNLRSNFAPESSYSANVVPNSQDQDIIMASTDSASSTLSSIFRPLRNLEISQNRPNKACFKKASSFNSNANLLQSRNIPSSDFALEVPSSVD